jgi:hypothetical protein
MPTKERRQREALRIAKAQQDKNQLANLPEHIKKRFEARKVGTLGPSSITAAILDSELPPYLKLRGGLLEFDSDGNVGVLAAGDLTGSANEERADARQRNIASLMAAYPEDWLQRRGAKRIALSEAEKQPNQRAVRQTRMQPRPISERTVQSYFKEIRKANRVP